MEPKVGSQRAGKNSFPVASWNEELGRFVAWDEMQQSWFRNQATTRLFQSLRHPFFWMLKAWELHEAATSLWANVKPPTQRERRLNRPEAHGFPDVVFMLAGMSIENLLKAKRVCATAWPIDDRAYSMIAKGSHWLDALSQNSSVRTNKYDRAILRTLSHYLRWNGRYFLPRTIEEFREHPGKGLSSADLWTDYVAVRLKVSKQLASAMRKWPEESEPLSNSAFEGGRAEERRAAQRGR